MLRSMRSLGVFATIALWACGGIAVIDGDDGQGGTSTGAGTSTTSTTSTTTNTGGQGAAPTCGNGIVDAGEECDDGNANPNDACVDGPDQPCTVAVCGDGVVWFGVEACDDGNVIDDDACNNACQVVMASCGNGAVEPGEQCDDGNTNPFDGCNNSCACSAQTSAPAWTFTGGWGLYTEAPPSMSVATPIFFPHPAIGTDGNRVPPYPGMETETSYAQTPVVTLPATLTFESWNVDEGSFVDTKRIKVSVNGGQTFLTLADCDQQNTHPFCVFTTDKPGDQWTTVSIPTGLGGQKGIVRIEYDTLDACCNFERGWFIRNANFFPCP
jgi:cysteine-rich repeat protein